MPHDIRLAGPWKRIAGEDSVEIRLPQAVQPAIILSRAFNRPSGLTEMSVTTLLVDASNAVQISLNESPLVARAADDVQEFDIGNSLSSFNTIRLSVEGDATVRSVHLRIYDDSPT